MSQIDVIGPQTLTAENPYSLPVAVAYTSPGTSGNTDILDHPVVETDDSVADMVKYSLNFNPLAEGMTTVELAQAHGSHTFPVEILERIERPPVKPIIPNREIVVRRRDTSMDLSRYFEGDNLTFTIT